jgi:hypothetical protein
LALFGEDFPHDLLVFFDAKWQPNPGILGMFGECFSGKKHNESMPDLGYDGPAGPRGYLGM